MRTSRHGWVLVTIAALTAVADLTTKLVAEINLVATQPIALIDGYCRLTLVHNTGTAFGLLPGQRLPFIIFSCVAIVAILILYRRVHDRTMVHVVAMGLLLGGALGNLHDRSRFGAVTDFIEIGVAGHYWPVFNLADAALSVGVGLLVLTMLRHETRARDEIEPDDAVRGG